MKSSMRAIDGQKLKEQLKQRGLTAQACSLALGCDRNYISACVNRGAMNNMVVVGLKREYNIDLSDYELTTDNNASASDAIVDAVEKTTDPIDYKLLYKTVYRAVYKATKRALSE